MTDVFQNIEKFDFKCRPETAWLNVNRMCNFRCKWCYGKETGFSKDDTMTLDMANRLIHISKDMGVKHVIFIGGEPTLWEDLFEANKICHSLGMTTGLITNAALFGDDIYWQRYIENEVDRLSISVKAADVDSFKGATGSGLYEKTRKGIERAVERKDVFITTVYNSFVGMDGFKKIVDWARDIGAENFIVTMCSPTEKNGDDVDDKYIVPLRKLSSDVDEIVSYLRETLDDKFQIDVQMPLCLFREELIDELLEKRELQTVCHVFSRNGISFTPRGEVIPCNELYETILATIDKDFIDADSLIEHLNSDEMCSLYKDLLRYPSFECDYCDRRTDCRGGCLMNWLVYEPDICKAVRKGVANEGVS